MNWSGSPPAMVGFNSGDGVHSQALPASLTPSVLEITETGNAGTSGKWVFRVDGANVEMMGKHANNCCCCCCCVNFVALCPRVTVLIIQWNPSNLKQLIKLMKIFTLWTFVTPSKFVFTVYCISVVPMEGYSSLGNWLTENVNMMET